MSTSPIATFGELKQAIDRSWSELEAFFSRLPESIAAQDAQGWTVADHLTHLAVWEDSVLALFRGRPRHEALGIPESFYVRASFDAINARIRERLGPRSTSEAIEHLRDVHRILMDSLASLSEADLRREVRDLFPMAPRTDDRLVIDFLYENTAHHFGEHLEWMVALLGGEA